MARSVEAFESEAGRSAARRMECQELENFRGKIGGDSGDSALTLCNRLSVRTLRLEADDRRAVLQRDACCRIDDRLRKRSFDISLAAGARRVYRLSPFVRRKSEKRRRREAARFASSLARLRARAPSPPPQRISAAAASSHKLRAQQHRRREPQKTSIGARLRRTQNCDRIRA